MIGLVKFFDKKKGWGYIIDEAGNDVFIHQTGILMEGYRFVNQGDKVEFEIATDNNGKTKAVNVKKIG